MKFLLLLLLIPSITLGQTWKKGSKLKGDWLLEVHKGNVEGHKFIHKFGGNPAVGTSFEPVTFSGVYQTPTTPQSLEMLSDNVNDTAAGTGGRTVKIEGINNTNGAWTIDTETITLNGTTAVALTKQWLRVYRMRVVGSGSYASAAGPSHFGTITLRGAGGGATWSQIGVYAGFGLGGTLIGAYSVPAGKTAMVISRNVYTDPSKSTDVLLFKRENADQTTAPFGVMSVQSLKTAQSAPIIIGAEPGVTLVTGPGDVGFMAKVASGSGQVAAEFDVILMDN